MKDTQSVRYIGYEGYAGGRSLDSLWLGDETKTVAIEVPCRSSRQTDRIAIQEASSICYETLKARLHTEILGPISLRWQTSHNTKDRPGSRHRKRVLAESVYFAR